MAGRERQILQRQFSRAVAHTDRTLLGDAPKVEAEKTRLSQKAPNVAFHRGDAEHLPYKASYFDLVTCGHALRHFPLAECVLGEIARIIKPSGRIVIFGPVAPETLRPPYSTNASNSSATPRTGSLSGYQIFRPCLSGAA